MARRFIFLFILIFFMITNGAASIYKKPRRVFFITTKYFDFIFPVNQKDLAYTIASKADDIFISAAAYFDLQKMKKPLHIPCAISCDSTVLSISYTSAPYNRITIMAAPGESTATNDTLISEFRRAVATAIASSVRTPAWQKINDVFGMESMQPVALLNIPTNFLNGVIDKYVYDVNNGVMDFESISDDDSLAYLVAAKARGEIPNYRDAMGGRDIHSKALGNILYRGFACYMQSRWGVSKFIEYWKMSGGLSYFKMASGIFKKVYGIKLSVAWHDFVTAIPNTTLPTFGTPIFLHNNGSTYSVLTSCKNGITYYDDARHNLYKVTSLQTPAINNFIANQAGNKNDTNNTNNSIYAIKIKWRKNLLSWASDVKTISPSACDVVAISYTTKKSNAKLSVDKTLLLNTKTGKYTKGRESFKNAAIIGKYLAGYVIDNNKITFAVHLLKYNKNGIISGYNKKPLFTYPLPSNIQTRDIVALNNNEVLCIYYWGNQCVFMSVDINSRAARYVKLSLDAKDFKPAIIGKKSAISFSYTIESPIDIVNYNRAGFVNTRRVGYIQDKKIFLGEDNFLGGIYDPLITDNIIYFVSHNGSNQELCWGDFNKLHFKQLPQKEFQYDYKTDYIESYAMQISKVHKQKDLNIKGGLYLGEYKVHNYNPLRYMNKMSITPFNPIVKLGVIQNKTEMGLGLRAQTSRDILDLLEFQMSATWGFIDYDEENRPFYDTNWALAFIINSSYLPLDLSLGVLWYFSNEGSYDLQVMFSTAYNIFCGMSIHKLRVTTNLLWDCTTKYRDYEILEEIHYTGFPNPLNMYNTMQYYAGITYSNYHQSGKSVYEERGVELGLFLINIVDPQKSKKIDDYENQLTMMLTAGVKFPWIIPVFNTGDFVVDLPTSFYARFYGEEKSAFEYRSETLLFGYELQHAIPGLPLYIQRLGLFFGYDFNIYHNELINAATDFKDIKTFLETYKTSKFSDYFFLKLTATVSPNIGKFTGKQITAGAEFCLDPKSLDFFVKAVFETKF